jgi:hypothetical protein
MVVWPKPSSTCILVGGEPLKAEYISSGVIYPGDVVEFTNAGAADKTIKACTDDSLAAIGFAIITPNISSTGTLTGGKVGQAFAAGDSVKVVKGDCFVMARLKIEEDMERGELLAPAGTGTVKVWEPGTDESMMVVAQAMEDQAPDSDLTYVLVDCRIP